MDIGPGARGGLRDGRKAGGCRMVAGRCKGKGGWSSKEPG